MAASRPIPDPSIGGFWREHPLEPETRIVCIGAPQGAAEPYGEPYRRGQPVRH